MQLTVSHAPIPIKTTSDAFDSISTWLSSPELAYSSWIAGLKYRASTKAIYIAMFSKFCRWLQGRGLRLIDCETGDIEQYFLDEAIVKEHRYRYILLIERVFRHLNSLDSSIDANPGRQAAWIKLNAGNNDPTAFLSKADRIVLSRRLEEMGLELIRNAQASIGEDEWTAVRDLALVGVLFGGGVKVSEAGSLTVSCIEFPDGWISIPDRGGHSHRSRLLPCARDLVYAWMQMRERLGLPGKALFPARKHAMNRIAGKPMHRASIFRRVQGVLNGYGIATGGDGGARRCAQTLRNSYVAELFDAGESNEMIAQALGLAQLVSVERFRSAYDMQRAEVGRMTTGKESL